MPSSIAYPWRNEMTIANRSIMFQQEEAGWKNPYVTDGLIAMWDGEWNAGPGKHDTNATVWKDLAGHSHDLTFSNSSFAILDNAVVFNDSTCYANAAYAAGEIASGNLTDEILILETPTYSTGSWNGICAISKCGIATNRAFTTLFLYGMVNTPTCGIPKIDTTLLTLTATSSASRLYVNASLIGTKSGLNTPEGSTGNGYTINRREHYTQYGLSKLTVGCRRVYDRILTAAEIAANYAVDKARFNLP